MNGASLALAARVVLAVVLVGSALAKLRTRAAVRVQMSALVGELLAPVVGPLLPAVELGVAVALVALRNAVPGSAALVLLAAFTVVLVRAQARHVPCLCFGAARAEAPVGPAAVVRNGLLAALAVLAIGSPDGAHAPATIVLTLAFGVVAAGAVRAAR